jgi:hypothetical protein
MSVSIYIYGSRGRRGEEEEEDEEEEGGRDGVHIQVTTMMIKTQKDQKMIILGSDIGIDVVKKIIKARGQR